MEYIQTDLILVGISRSEDANLPVYGLALRGSAANYLWTDENLKKPGLLRFYKGQLYGLIIASLQLA